MASYLRYITFKRLRNAFRCRLSFILSASGVERYRHMPTFLSVEPANWCMLRCPQCPVGQRGAAASAERQTMSEELCRRVIDQAAPTAHTVIFHFQGEPLLNSALPAMIAYAHARKLYTMLSTNAQTLTPALAEQLVGSGLDRIIVSIDGLTQESYAHYRVGGHLDRALDGMRALADSKKQMGCGPEIVLQCLLLRSNEAEWPLFSERYKSLGADRLEMKTAQFYDYKEGNPDMPTDLRYARYVRNADGSYRLKKPLRNRCYRLWSGCVVTTDGTVLPCCFDKDHTYRLGNLNGQSLEEIMHSESAKRFRKALLKNRAGISICTNCSE